MFRTTLAVVLCLILGACGKDTPRNPSDPQKGPAETPLSFRGKVYRVMEGKLTGNETEVSGTGVMLFRDPLPSDDNRYGVSFSLEEGGSVTFITNANSNRSKGYVVQFMNRKGKLTYRHWNVDAAMPAGLEERSDTPVTSAVVQYNIHAGHRHGTLFSDKNGTAEGAVPFFGISAGLTERLVWVLLERGTLHDFSFAADQD